MGDSGFNLPQVTVSEVDGTPRRYAIQELEFPNGSITVSGNKATINGATAIGGAVSGGTAGSVLFINPTNILAQDNSNFFYDDTLNGLFLGSTSTGYQNNGTLNVNGDFYFKSSGLAQTRTITLSRQSGDDAQDHIKIAGGSNPGAGVGSAGNLILTGGTANNSEGQPGYVYVYGGTSDASGDGPVYLAYTEGAAVRGTVICAGSSSVGRMTVYSGTSSTIGLVVKGVALQSASLQEWHTSLAAVVGTITVAGQMTLPNSGSSAGLSIGGDTQLYRRTTNVMALASGDSLEVPTNFAVGNTIDTTIGVRSYASVATGYTGVGVDINMNSATASDRPWGMRFSCTQTGSANYSSALGATGMEGLGINAGSGTAEGTCGGIFYARNSGSGTLVRAVGILINTNENTGAGSVTNSRLLDIAAGGPTITANNQTRISLRFGIAPDPGAFTGTISRLIQVNSDVTGLRSAFHWGTSSTSTANLYLSAANTLKTDGAFVIAGTATLAVVAGAVDAGGSTSFEIPNGAGGTTVDANGECTVDTTASTFNYFATSERVLNPVQSKSITIENPSASEDLSIFYTDDAITVTKIVFVITGSTSVTTTIRHGTDRSAAGTEIVTGGTVANNSTTGNVVTSFNDATVVADAFIWLETTALSSTPTSLSVTIFYTQDA